MSTKHASPLAATLTGLRDLLRPRKDIDAPPDSLRLDGVHFLVTGASNGLGRAVAGELASRGAALTLNARSLPHELIAELTREGAPSVRLLPCDLSDLEQVRAFATQLRDGAPLHSLILNAGLMARETRITPQGLEEMHAVHFMANLVIIQTLATHLVARPHGSPAQVIVTSSEAHRSAPERAIEDALTPPTFGVRDGMKWYGHSKLLMLTWLNGADLPELDVCALCPGPVASNIARESPAWLRPFLGPLMRVAFNNPVKAATPILYFAAYPKLGRADNYLHMRAFKKMDPRVYERGRQIALVDVVTEFQRTLGD